MISLILDSSYKDLVVGLGKDDELIDEISYDAWQRQSELMIPEIDNLLKKHNIKPTEVNEIIVTLGPGSYTGVRIALTVAKVYCATLKIPCYALSSLKVLSKLNAPSICLVNARSSRSYIGVYKNNECLLKDQILTNEEVLKFVNEHQEYIVAGDTAYLGIEGYSADLAKNMLALKNDEDKVKDILALKAVYLKD